MLTYPTVTHQTFQIKQEFLEDAFQKLSCYKAQLQELRPTTEQEKDLQLTFSDYIIIYGNSELQKHYFLNQKPSTWDYLEAYYFLASNLTEPVYQIQWLENYHDMQHTMNPEILEKEPVIWLNIIDQIIELLENNVRVIKEIYG